MSERDFVPPTRSPREILYPRMLFHALEDSGLNPEISNLNLEWFSENKLLGGLVNYYHGDVKLALSQTQPFFGHVKSLRDRETGGDLEAMMKLEFAREPLLSWDEEVALAQLVEQGREAIQSVKAARNNGGLSAGEQKKLWGQVEDAKIARDLFYTANLRLVMNRASHYAKQLQAGYHPGKQFSYTDLCQEGAQGLGIAIRKYNWKKGNRFSTYATWWINQTISRAIDQKGSVVRLPLNMSAKIGRVFWAISELEQAGEVITPEKIGQKTKLKPTKVKTLMEISETMVIVPSLDAPVESRRSGDDDGSLYDFIPDLFNFEEGVDQVSEGEELVETVSSALSTLLEREREVILLRYLLPREEGDEKEGYGYAIRTLDEVAKIRGLSRERIRQIEKMAKRKLKTVLEAGKLLEQTPSF